MESARLNHDPAVLSQLSTILRQQNGLVLVQEGSRSTRTFLTTALGHAWEKLHLGSAVRGIDAHAPDWFVPLDDVIYLQNLLEPKRLRAAVQAHWPKLLETRHGCIILNGVWAAMEATSISPGVNAASDNLTSSMSPLKYSGPKLGFED